MLVSINCMHRRWKKTLELFDTVVSITTVDSLFLLSRELACRPKGLRQTDLARINVQWKSDTRNRQHIQSIEKSIPGKALDAFSFWREQILVLVMINTRGFKPLHRLNTSRFAHLPVLVEAGSLRWDVVCEHSQGTGYVDLGSDVVWRS